MKYSMRNLAIALGFFSISIFPSYFSMLMRTFEVGGSSVRAGLIISVVFFFLMVIPFGVRYFGTPKIILSNIPSHNEMLRNFKTKKIILNNSEFEFNMFKNINNKIDAISWVEVSKKLFDIINNFNKSSDSILDK